MLRQCPRCRCTNGFERRRMDSLFKHVVFATERTRFLGSLSHNEKPIDYNGFHFEVLQESKKNKARRCNIRTPHGSIQTPSFVFCATKAAVKGGVTPEMLRNEGTSIILSNTYHLLLQPGPDCVKKMGGLQRMTNWNGPMLTDSGGYQIFSMGHGSVSSEIKGRRSQSKSWNKTLLKVDENGATFRSFIDGAIHTLTPENSISTQEKLGADLVVVLDECTPYNVDKSYTASSMRRSHRWALRSLKEFRKLRCSNAADGKNQALYGIVQGGVFEDLRRESANFINHYPFFGTAIGGSLGPDKECMQKIVSFVRPLLRNDRPVHLLGIGGIKDIFHGVRLGIDTFDCVHPTRLGRHGGAYVKASYWNNASHADKFSIENSDTLSASFTYEKKLTHQERKELRIKHMLHKQRIMQEQSSRVVREYINVSKAYMESDPSPIDSHCSCYTCKNFSRGYLHHLFKSKEMLGPTLVTLHNVHFINNMMSDIRQAIESDTLDEMEKEYVHPDTI